MTRSPGRLLAVALAAAMLSLVGCGWFAGGPQLDGTSWRLTGWSAGSLDPAAYPIGAQFADGRIGGQAPVNSYGGSYKASADGRFTTKDIVMTMMAGPEPAMRAEEAYFALLGKARGYALDRDRLALLDAGGHELLVFGPRP
ncbi:MAG: META domain-containing protein [Thermoleophilia bacterium]